MQADLLMQIAVVVVGGGGGGGGGCPCGGSHIYYAVPGPVLH